MEERKKYSKKAILKRITTLLLYIFPLISLDESYGYSSYTRMIRKRKTVFKHHPHLNLLFILTIKTGSLKITGFWKKVINLQPQLFQNHDQMRYIRFKT